MNENLFQYLTRRQKFLLIFIPILITLIIAGTLIFSYFYQKSRRVEVIDLENKVSASILDQDTFKEQLKRVIDKNPDLKDKPTGSATIRDYQEETKDEVTTATFLVDLDELQQTFAVSFSWSDTTDLINNISIECPTPSETKYPNSTCVGMYNTSSSPELYLPYTGETADGISYTISEKHYNGGDIYLEVSTKDCQNLSKAKSSALSWLSTTPLNSYPVEVKRFCN